MPILAVVLVAGWVEELGAFMELAKKDGFFARMRRQFAEASAGGWDLWRYAAVRDTEFLLGEHWDADDLAKRQRDKRPALTVNRLPECVAQVENETRQQRIEIKVLSLNDGEEAKKTAEIQTDLIRTIQRKSQSRVSSNTAIRHQLTAGLGWLRVGTQYASDDPTRPDCFDQDIVLLPVSNQFAVYFDPSASEFDLRDARYMFVASSMSREAFRSAYPNSEAASFDEGATGDLGLSDWISRDAVRIVEYFYVEDVPTKVYLTIGQQVVTEAEMVTLPPEARPAIVAQRTIRTPKVHYCKATAVDVLEQTEWLGNRIPLVPVWGEVTHLNGKVDARGIVRNAISSSQMMNFWLTAATEKFALSSKAPWVMAEGQDEGHPEWSRANQESYAYLTYKPVTAGGQLAPPPQRMEIEPAIQGMVQMFGVFDQQFRSTTRLYAASLGDTGPERSGRAIVAQRNQSAIANLNYSDNLLLALQSVGEIILSLIPKIYTRERLVSIIAADGSDRQVWLNKPFTEGGLDRIYDVTTGRYHVTVVAGPSYETKRQEAASAMVDMAKADPVLMQAAPDIVYSSMDWPMASEIAERRKKMLPPELQDKPEGEAQQIPPAMQAQMAALMQQNQALTAALNEAAEELSSKRMDIDSKERIAAINAEVKLIIEEMKANNQASLALMTADMQAVRHKLDLMTQADARDMQQQAPPMASGGMA
jgi:hypothetical protein